jgi:hypothetical protein
MWHLFINNVIYHIDANRHVQVVLFASKSWYLKVFGANTAHTLLHTHIQWTMLRCPWECVSFLIRYRSDIGHGVWFNKVIYLRYCWYLSCVILSTISRHAISVIELFHIMLAAFNKCPSNAFGSGTGLSLSILCIARLGLNSAVCSWFKNEPFVLPPDACSWHCLILFCNCHFKFS